MALRRVYAVVLVGGVWRAATGGGIVGTMTIYEARREARRRNEAAGVVPKTARRRRR